MKFTRTDNGLSNSALFYSVDYVVYTEGGDKNFTPEDIQKGLYNEKSADIKFWSMVFSKHNSTKKLKFKSVGSKSCLNHICQGVESSSVTGTIVALDSDLDEYLVNKFNSPFILYTKGYSWENDVYHPNLVLQQISAHAFLQQLPQEDQNSIMSIYRQFERHLPRLLRVELASRYHGHRLITSFNGERFVCNTGQPNLDIFQVRTVIRKARQKLPRPIKTEIVIKPKTNFYACTYGKLIEAFSISVIKSFLRKYGHENLPKSFLQSSMINAYLNHAQNDPYYDALIQKIEAV